MGAGAWRRRNGGLSLVQCPSIVYGPSVASAARRARVGSARAGPRPQRERAQWRASALHAQATTRNEREGWHEGAGAWRRRNGGLSLVQCPSIVYGPSVAGLARRARASEAPVLGLVPRESERSGAQARYTRKPPRAVRGRAGTWEQGPGADGTAASRSCSALPWCMERVSPARRGARASEAPVLGLVPRESERSGAQARYTRKPPRAVRGRAGTWEQGPGADGTAASRSCSALPSCMGRVSPARRGGARVGSARAGPRPQRERAQWRASALHAQATTRNEREGWHEGAGAWRRRNGGLSLVQCPSIVYGPSVAGLARRARASEAPVLGLVPRESERSGAQARYTRKPPRAVRGRAGTWEQGPGADGTAASRSCSALPRAYGPSVASAARRARVGSARAGPRPQRERAQWRASALHAQATTRNEREGWHVGAGAWRRRNGGLSLVQCPSIVYGPSVAGLARRARASEAPVLGLVPRESERSGAQARYTRKPPRAVRGKAGTWEQGPGADGTAASRSCSALPSCMDRVSPARRGARASEAPVLGLVPRESERSGAQARYTRKPPRAVRGRAGTWEQGPGADGTAASRSCSALPSCMDRVSPARRGARASEAPVLGLVPRESERSGAQARYTRKPPRAMRGKAGTWEQGPGADGTAASRSCSALPSCMGRVSPAWRGARARRKRPCWASSPERASAVARKRATRASHHAQ